MAKEKNDYKSYDYKSKDESENNPKETRPKRGFWHTFFMVIGIIAVIIILMIAGTIIALIIIKPFDLDVSKLPGAILQMDSDTPSSYDHPLISTEQEKILESMGIETEEIPTQITPEQEQCAVEALGQERVNEIKAGASPTLSDYLKAKDCL